MEKVNFSLALISPSGVQIPMIIEMSKNMYNKEIVREEKNLHESQL